MFFFCTNVIRFTNKKFNLIYIQYVMYILIKETFININFRNIIKSGKMYLF